MTRILHLINNLAREGAQVVVHNLVSYPGGGEIEHIVFSREPNGQLQPVLEERGVRVYSPDRYYGLARTGRSVDFIESLVEKERIDVIHAHMGDAAFLGWLVARKNGTPLLITHHGHDVLPVCGRLCRAVYLRLIRLAARNASWNIAVSESVAGQVHEKLKIAREKICFIGNGVPVPSQSQLEEQGDEEKSPLTIVTVGRLVDIKGQDQLIDAAAALIDDYPEAKFYLVGDGPLRSELESRAQERGVSRNVVFTGVVEDVSTYLRNADIFISTSHSEGMPMATLEAMSWNVPVITSDIPGNCSVVSHGKTGLLYPLGNVDALQCAIHEVLNKPGEASSRCHTARRLVEESYSVDATIRAHESLYSAVARPLVRSR